MPTSLLIRSCGHASTLLALAVLVCVPAPLLAQRSVEMPGTDRALQPQLEEVFRLGKIDGADWEIFGADPEIAFDGAGNLYVLDPTSHRVVVVDRSGGFLREIGRRGDGPGELRSPQGFVVMPDGTVAIADLGHGAFVLFGADGSYLRSVNFRAREGLTEIGELHALPELDAILSAGRRAAMIQAGAGMAFGAAAPQRAVTRFDLQGGGAGERVFTGWTPTASGAQQARGPGGAQMRGPGGGAPGGGMGAMTRPMPPAFEPPLLVAALPDGRIVVSDSTAYALKVVSPDGQVERVLRRPFQATPVTPSIERAERERRLADIAAGGTGGAAAGQAMMGGGGGGAPSSAQMQAIRRQQVENLEFFPEIAVLAGLKTGWTGKIWVERSGPGGDPTAEGPIDVLSPTGEYLGTIAPGVMKLPDAFGPDGLVAWIERDMFDTAIVAVRRLPETLR